MPIPVEQTHLYREIHEQPETIATLLEKEQQTIAQLAAEIKRRKIKHIVIAARGTSDNAARYAGYLLGALNGILVTLATPSLFTIYKRPPQLKGALVLGISQSGKSPDIISVLAEGREQGALTAALTNTLNSDITRDTDFVIHLNAGPEQSLAATKTYTAQLAALACLSVTLSADKARRAVLNSIPEMVHEVLDSPQPVEWIANRLRYMQHCVVVGRGYNYATAHELALKLKELTYTIAEPYSSADFLHGPVALIETGFPVLVVAPSGAMCADMQDLIKVVQKQNAEVIVLTDDSACAALADHALLTPQPVAEWLSPITTIIPGQLLALHLAACRGYDVDHPRGLSKVTETW